MTVGHLVRVSAPWVAFAGASAVTATIVVLAPQAASAMLAALIAGWALLGIVRVVVIVGVAQKIYHSLDELQVTHAGH